MGGIHLKPEVKMAILELILKKKAILFGQFSSTLENPEKTKAWDEITLKAKSLGECNEGRDWIFVRDKMFGQWKSNTLAKRDKSRKTGTGGGRECVLTEVDLKILEIVGTDSPIIDGLSIGESGVPVQSTPSLNVGQCSSSTQQHSTQESNPIQTAQGVESGQRSSKPKRKSRFIHSEILDTKRKKQTELLAVAIYNEKLAAYEKEKSPTTFTIHNRILSKCTNTCN